MPRRPLIFTMLAVVCGTLLGPAGTAAHAGVAGAQAAQTKIDIDRITPAVPTERSTIKISGRVRNKPNAGPLTARLLFSRARLRTREELDGHINGERVLAPAGAPVEIPAGREGNWRFELRASALGISQTGGYPIAVQVLDRSLRQVAIERTFLPFNNAAAEKPKPVRAAWLVPVIDRPHRSSDGSFVDDDLATELSPDGRLGRIVERARKPASWVLDPGLLDDAQVLAKRSAVAAEWLARLRSSIGSAPVFVTPYADPDAAALAHAGRDAYLERGMSRGKAIAENILKREVDAGLAWPARSADLDTLEALAVSGADRVVLDARQFAADPPLTYTPDQVTTVDTVNGPMTAYLADPRITRTMAGAGGAVNARQRYLTETAVLAGERPDTSPTLIAVPPRNADPAVLESVMGARAPWLKNIGLAKAKPARENLAGPEAAGPGRELSKARMKTVKRLIREAEAAYSITRFPAGSEDRRRPFDLAILRTTSSAWLDRGNAAARRKVYAGVEKAIEQYTERVRVVSPLEYTTGTSGKIPVSVENTLPVAVVIRIEVTAAEPRYLKIGEYNDLIEIGPHRSDTIVVPVTAKRIGQSAIDLRLLTEDGRRYGPRERVSLQVTGYTTVALAIVGGALGVMAFAIGARLVRRWRPVGEHPEQDRQAEMSETSTARPT